VQAAFEQEIEKLRSFNDILPIDDYILTDAAIVNSTQIISGRDKKLLWLNFPILE